jgi:hypothetical protein
MAAFWCLVVIAGIGVLFLKQLFPDDALAGYAVRGLYVTVLAVSGVGFWIASGFSAFGAEGRIKRLFSRGSRRLKRIAWALAGVAVLALGACGQFETALNTPLCLAGQVTARSILSQCSPRSTQQITTAGSLSRRSRIRPRRRPWSTPAVVLCI